MFKNHIPEFPQFGRQGVPAAKPDLTNPIPDLYTQEGDPPQGWGLTFQVTTEGCGPGKGTGRSNGTVHWAGLANLFWWCDREAGVAGMIASQILPFARKYSVPLRSLAIKKRKTSVPDMLTKVQIFLF